MENRIVFKDKELKKNDNHILGICGENEQEILVFGFEDGFVDGTGFLEIEFPGGCCGRKCSIELVKDLEKECYKLQVKSSLLRFEGTLRMQLKIVDGTKVWKSAVFDMIVDEAINATESVEEDYPDLVGWLKTRMSELEEGVEQLDKRVEGIKVPTKLSELEDDSNFVRDANYVHTDNNFTTADKERLDGLTAFTECDPTVPAWAKEPSKPMYTASEVGALSADTVLFSGDYEDLRNKPELPSIEGLATEEYVNSKIGDIDTILSKIADESEAI